ncbi:MAG: efflux RND transporter periplasmic adaptor subunit [Bacteroidales bacterium]|nr:efflux RND transporter periplasmic adaptor subunit [Bacteroidales bacterium]
MKKIDRRIIIVLSFLFIVALSYGIMRFLIAQKEEAPAFKSFEAKRFVRADIITYGEVISPVSETGRMSSIAQVNLSAEASGKIEQGDIMLKKGGNFKKGDVIFSIYRDEAALALKAKKSQFLNTLALLLPDIAVDFPENEETFRQFFSSIDMEKPLPDFPIIDNEKLKIFLAGRNVLSEYYNIRKDELQLSRHVITAPFNGTLTDVFLEVGAYTNTGGTVARAIRTDQLELEVPLRRDDALWVRIGDPVKVSSDSRSHTWQGTVTRKGMLVDENTQSQSVYVHIKNNTDQPLLAGEFLSASFPGRPIKGVMEIPRNAVFNTNEVFIVNERRLVKEKINIIKVNTNTLLFNGPYPGDTLVVQSLINVFEGTQVTTSLDNSTAQNGRQFKGRPDNNQ